MNYSKRLLMLALLSVSGCIVSVAQGRQGILTRNQIGPSFQEKADEESFTRIDIAAEEQSGQESNTQRLLQKSSQKGIKDQSQNEFSNRVRQISTAAKGHVGVAAMLLEIGNSLSLNPHDHFPMQSVYKLPIAMAVLREVDGGKINLAQRVRVEKADFVREGQHSPLRDEHPNGVEISLRELLLLAVSESDGTASDVLLKIIGGPQPVGKYLKEIGVTEMVIANTEKEIGRDWKTQYRNWASPESALALLRSLHEGRGLSRDSRNVLLKMMMESPTGPRRIKGLLPEGTMVAHKTGTSGTSNGITAATNDIGIVTLPDGNHAAIAIFVSDSPVDEATREGVISKIARAIWDEWSINN